MRAVIPADLRARLIAGRETRGIDLRGEERHKLVLGVVRYYLCANHCSSIVTGFPERSRAIGCCNIPSVWLRQRAINLRPLSTSAPAVSFRGDPSVSRRGTCDRGICTKPLARRTRWSYGFRMRDSRFVRRRVGLRVGLRGVVKGVGESVGRSEEAIRCGQFRTVSGGWRWRTVSTDTTAVGAEARVVESDLVG